MMSKTSMTRPGCGRCLFRLAPGVALLLAGSAVVAGELQVTHSGVGESVVERELVGPSERFVEGGEVWFWNRVEGGDEGDLLRHVWLRAGEEVATVELEVGGSPWRTYSRKKMYPGSAGSWAVEARTADGAVLSRREFTCVAPGSEPDDDAGTARESEAGDREQPGT
jgi:hypothetical protein